MTLIISKTSRNYVLQVTDRLVTKSGASFDPLANKNIIFCALNGILSFAYTGYAYIGSTPTDQWLAEQLIGKRLKDDLWSSEFGPIKMTYIGPALQALIGALNRAFTEDIGLKFKLDWFTKRFNVSFVGYVWKKEKNSKRKFRPFSGGIFKPPFSERFYIYYSNRYWYFEFQVDIAPGGNVTQEQSEILKGEVKNKEFDETENIIVKFIREISRNNYTVGSDCMSILIPPPSQAHIDPVRIRFLPESEHAIEMPNIAQEMIKIAYSPWLIGPRFFSPPCILGNTAVNIRLNQCFYKVKIEGPNIPGEGMFYEAQKRKKLQ